MKKECSNCRYGKTVVGYTPTGGRWYKCRISSATHGCGYCCSRWKKIGEIVISSKHPVPGIYRFLKDDSLYYVEGVAEHSENNAQFVIYRGETDCYHACPIKLFLKRFKLMRVVKAGKLRVSDML